MSLKVGIVGLPNVGKSTLFNALTKQAAESANFPFTTIEPNVGVVTVPDERLDKLAVISKSEKILPTTIEFVDIAGLVKGAHQGEGLGNKFLSHIREVDAIVHVVRFFDDGDIQHVDDSVDPLRDVETIETELALADLATQEKMEAKGTNLEHEIQQLKDKPTLYVANLSEDQIRDADAVIAKFTKDHSPVLPLSVKIEQELVELSEEERMTFLNEYGLKQTGLDRLIAASYELLKLVTFITTGPMETRAWTVPANSLAPVAAGTIHSDMERGFIRAETVSYDDLVAAGSYASARAAGNVRDEGKEYVVQDGDIFLFKFSV
ncbi:redox-regulated ATPase YchF [bacterium]|nr:redox-regulated ATPase YchF [bacterium]